MTTALIVVGVDAAIGRVALDVTFGRPAPMTPREVDEELRDREGTTRTHDEPIPEPTVATPTAVTTPRPVPPGSSPPAATTGEPHGPGNTGPGSTGPDPAGEPRGGTGTPSTTTGGAPGGPVGQEGTPRP